MSVEMIRERMGVPRWRRSTNEEAKSGKGWAVGEDEGNGEGKAREKKERGEKGREGRRRREG